ncbi:hypothetical protein HOH54_00135 [bacterium]|nr:hypothetical protein [bacterium]
MKRLAALLALIMGFGCSSLAMENGSSSETKQDPLQSALLSLGFSKTDATTKDGLLVSKKMSDIKHKALLRAIHKRVYYRDISHNDVDCDRNVELRTIKWGPNSEKLAITPGVCNFRDDGQYDEGVSIYNALTKKTNLLSCDGAGMLKHNKTVWSHNGDKIADIYDKSPVRIWDVNTAQEISKFKHQDAMALCWSPDDDTIVVVEDMNKDIVVNFFDTKSGQKRSFKSGVKDLSGFQYLSCPTSLLVDAKWNPDNDNQLAIRLDEVVSMLDVRSGKCVKHVITEYESLADTIPWAKGLIPDIKTPELSCDGSMEVKHHYNSICQRTFVNLRDFEADKLSDGKYSGVVKLGLDSFYGKVQSTSWAPDNTRFAVDIGRHCKVYDIAGKFRHLTVDNLLFLSSITSKNQYKKNKLFDNLLSGPEKWPKEFEGKAFNLFINKFKSLVSACDDYKNLGKFLKYFCDKNNIKDKNINVDVTSYFLDDSD